MTQEERQALERFPKAAQEFCQFVEQCGLDDRGALLKQLFERLARVCDIANRLPWVDPTTENIKIDPNEIESHATRCFELSERFRKAFGNVDSYWDVFDPTQKEEPLNGSLARDIAEVYMDLKDALSLFGSGTDLNDAYWQWRCDFRSHWARHAGSALKVLLLSSDVG